MRPLHQQLHVGNKGIAASRSSSLYTAIAARPSGCSLAAMHQNSENASITGGRSTKTRESTEMAICICKSAEISASSTRERHAS